MQDSRMLVPEEVIDMQTWKKFSTHDQPQRKQFKGALDVLAPQRPKGSKRNLRNNVSSLPQLSDKCNSDSLPTASGDEYWSLRRKILQLEEESCSLGRELMEVEDEVNNLEDEKLALLDQLVVLEGLIDPSELVYPQ